VLCLKCQSILIFNRIE